MKSFIIYLLSLSLLFFCITEVLLRVTHIAPEFPERMLDEQFGVYKFKPNQSGIYANGRLGEWKALWIINNEGWNSELTYIKGEEITGIIGDSYIQTIYFDPVNHVYNLFKENSAERTFYSFGIQGASFSQYLNILRYASETYQMDSVFIFLDNNDIEESITSMIKMPRNMQLKIDGNSIQEIPAVYHEKFYRNFFKDIAVFRYMLMNFSFKLNLGAAKENRKNSLNNKNDFEAKKHHAVEYIVAEMQKCNVNHITFVLDADRNAIYDGVSETHSKFWKYFAKVEENNRIMIIDLQEFLSEEYVKNNTKFEVSSDNNHWNLATNKKIAKYLALKTNMH